MDTIEMFKKAVLAAQREQEKLVDLLTTEQMETARLVAKQWDEQDDGRRGNSSPMCIMYKGGEAAFVVMPHGSAAQYLASSESSYDLRFLL